jgi:hypothetical protein
LLEQLFDRRAIERSSVTPTGRIDMERTERGTIGYQALRSHLMDACIELLRRFYQTTRVEGDHAKRAALAERVRHSVNDDMNPWLPAASPSIDEATALWRIDHQ